MRISDWSSDVCSSDLACWLAGEFERNRVFGEGQWESLDQRELISGWSPFTPVDDDAPPPDAGGAGFYFKAARGFLDSAAIGSATAKPTYAPDIRFVHEATTQATQIAALSDHQQATWRQEYRDRPSTHDGNQRSTENGPG